MKESKTSTKLDSQNKGHLGNDAKSKNLRRRYADFFEFAPVGYFTLDRIGFIREANSAGAMLIGIEKNKLLNQQISKFISPDSYKIFEKHSIQLFDTRTKQTCDLKLLEPSKKTSWVQLESLASQNDGENSEMFRTVISDISDRKKNEKNLRNECDRLEQRVIERTASLEKINEKLRRQIFECELAEVALKESEQKYSTLVEDALVGVYVIKDGKIEFVNDKFASIYGYTKSELIGMETLELVHPEDRPQVKEMREKRLKGEMVPSEYEIRGLKKDGDTIWVTRSISLINYKDGPAIAGIVSDITERVEAEEALRESDKELRILSNQLLSAEEKERKRIAREMHDSVGQALSAIKFSVENSLRELRNQPNLSELKSLEAVIPLTQKTIEDVRRIVRDLRPSILDDLGIKATIKWFCREFSTVYTDIQINRELDFQEDAVPLALKTIIYRILQEALNNVAKHSRADSVLLTLKKEDNTIKFRIEDNGLGFDIANALSLKPSRRGFGLASMRERAELSGGEFDINSMEGKGTWIKVNWKI